MNTFYALLFWAAIIAAYWAPSFIAWRRHVRNLAPVVVLNFFGILAITWIVALAWALSRDTEPGRSG